MIEQLTVLTVDVLLTIVKQDSLYVRLPVLQLQYVSKVGRLKLLKPEQ